MQIPFRLIPLQLLGGLQKSGRLIQDKQGILGHIIIQMNTFRVEQTDIFIDFREIGTLPQHLQLPAHLLTQTQLGLTVTHLLKLPLQHCRRSGRSRILAELIEYNLLGRCNLHTADLIDGALIHRVEGTDGVYFIIKQLHPVSQWRGHGIEVDNTAAYTKLTAVLYPLHPLIAHLNHGHEEVIQWQGSVLRNRKLGFSHDMRSGSSLRTPE